MKNIAAFLFVPALVLACSISPLAAGDAPPANPPGKEIGYGAYSHAFENLWGTTEPNTFWGGAKLVYAF
jgi:hypothetical protein